MAFILVPYVTYTIYAEATHHHSEPAPAYPHLKIAHKRWPWEVDCAMFDSACVVAAGGASGVCALSAENSSRAVWL